MTNGVEARTTEEDPRHLQRSDSAAAEGCLSLAVFPGCLRQRRKLLCCLQLGPRAMKNKRSYILFLKKFDIFYFFLEIAGKDDAGTTLVPS